MPVRVSAPAPEPIPADCTAPSSLAAVLAARAALAVLPAVKSLESMLIGIVAIRKGVLREFSIDSDDDDDDDDDDDVSVAVAVRLARDWGDARLCRACGIPEITLEGTAADWQRLRDKVEQVPAAPAQLQTVWGVGYRWEANPS